jgi:hypothetical protein
LAGDRPQPDISTRQPANRSRETVSRHLFFSSPGDKANRLVQGESVAGTIAEMSALLWPVLNCLAYIAPMKKLRVVVRTVLSHQIYVERDGERTLYAVTDTVKEARALVMKAKRELGIARASSEGLLKVHPEK